MKKLYFLPVALFMAFTSFAQCTIDPAVFAGATGGGVYPAANHLPHIVPDSLYDQTVQGMIPDTMSMNFGGIISASITIDSVRLDTIYGLPNGINWIKNPAVLQGGGYGCVEFTGTTTDTPGTYNMSAVGMIWVHLSVPVLGIDEDTSQYGSLNRFPPFNRYYLVIDSAAQPLSVTATANSLCFGDTTGTATAFAAGGSGTAPYSYLWSTGATTYRLNNVAAGTYNVTAYNGADSASTSVTIVSESSPITLSTWADSGSTGANGIVAVTASGGIPPYTYRWTGGASTDTVTGLAPGTYRITVIDSFGCIARDSAVVANLVNGITSLNEIVPQISLFPNPANSAINIVIESTQAVTTKLEIIDMVGRTVYAAPVTVSGRYTQTLNTSQYGAGIYTVQLISGTQTVHQRFVVAR